VWVRGIVRESGPAVQIVRSRPGSFTGAAGIHQAATAARSPARNFLTCAPTLTTRPESHVQARRIGRAVPLVADDMDVRVADAAVEDLDVDIVRAGLPAQDVGRRKRRRGGLGEYALALNIEHI